MSLSSTWNPDEILKPPEVIWENTGAPFEIETRQSYNDDWEFYRGFDDLREAVDAAEALSRYKPGTQVRVLGELPVYKEDDS